MKYWHKGKRPLCFELLFGIEHQNHANGDTIGHWVTQKPIGKAIGLFLKFAIVEAETTKNKLSNHD